MITLQSVYVTTMHSVQSMYCTVSFIYKSSKHHGKNDRHTVVGDTMQQTIDKVSSYITTSTANYIKCISQPQLRTHTWCFSGGI